MIGLEEVRKAIEDAEAIGSEFDLEGGNELLEHAGVEPDSIRAFCAYRVNQLTADPTARFFASQMDPEQAVFAAKASLWMDGLLIGLQLGRMENDEPDS